jgi:UDP-2,3-diacylglucosamine pyrophosphatase LpxH
LNAAFPTFDELFVVSDIHMGGPAGFQMFNMGSRLGNFIRSLAVHHPKKDVGLVMNGDIFDSLAEDEDGYIAFQDAESMIARIAKDPAFEPVWNGLSSFVQKPKRHLVLVMGNHDLELAFPNVQFLVRHRIAAGDPLALGRIAFFANGAGFSCMVGGARVLCTHGNEVDDWNIVDQESLSDLASAINADRFYPLSEWRPNAGTRLVVDVINAIKREYPFVDLLKPETKALVPILLVMDPGKTKAVIRALPKVSSDLVWGMLERQGILSVEMLEASNDPRTADATLGLLLGDNLKSRIGPLTVPSRDERSILLAMEKDIAEGKPPQTGCGPDGNGETLGTLGYIFNRIRGIPKAEALRRALLDWLEKDDTFSIDKRDGAFDRMTASIGASIDFIVAGHTHLARAIPFSGGRCFYYNTGTWARLLQLSESLLGDSHAFEQAFNALGSGRLEDLDGFEVDLTCGGRARLVKTWTTAVHIAVKHRAVHGEILDISEDSESSIRMTPVKGSRFTRTWR